MSGLIASASLRKLSVPKPSFPEHIPGIGDQLILRTEVDGTQPGFQVFKSLVTSQGDLVVAMHMPSSQSGWLEVHAFRPHISLYDKDGHISPEEEIRQYGLRNLTANPRAHKGVVLANPDVFKEIATSSVWTSEVLESVEMPKSKQFCHADIEWNDDKNRPQAIMSNRSNGHDYRWWFVGVPV